MKRIEVKTACSSYDILIAKESVNFLNETVLNIIDGRSVFLVIDSAVEAIYGKKISEFLNRTTCFRGKYIVPAGEINKNFRTLEDILRNMLRSGADRKTILIAAGGGVTGDIGGFAASIFMRGIEYIQLPTTLLAMVDSSVGGKTAVDIPEGKNIAGSFWQPAMTAIDITKLKTLPKREIAAGLAEVVKYAVIKDMNFFDYLTGNVEKIRELNLDVYKEIIAWCCAIKAEIVGKDEKEISGERALLNLGHTFGHALETLSGYDLFLHGEAVAIGIMMASELSCLMGFFDEQRTLSINRLLTEIGLKTKAGIGLNPEALYKSMFSDKKSLGGKINFVVPIESIGRAGIISDVPEKYIIEAIKRYL